MELNNSPAKEVLANKAAEASTMQLRRRIYDLRFMTGFIW